MYMINFSRISIFPDIKLSQKAETEEKYSICFKTDFSHVYKTHLNFCHLLIQNNSSTYHPYFKSLFKSNLFCQPPLFLQTI